MDIDTNKVDAWVQRWKDAAVLVETDELAALKEGKALIKEASELNLDYKEVIPLMKPFTKVLVEHNLMLGSDRDNRSDHNREGCEICTMMLASRPEQETVWASGSEGCGDNCECNCN